MKLRKHNTTLYSYIIFFLILLVSSLYLVINPVFIFTKSNNSLLVNKENLYSDVEFLTSLNPSRNYQNMLSLNQAAEYIKTEFEKTGCKVEIQNFAVQEKEYKNIICSFGIQNLERLIVGAHYDVHSDRPGADDNASGVAGILELARIMSRENPNLNHRVDFVAYTLEEPPFFRTQSMGSAQHAKSLKKNDIKVIGMISMEMIGYFSDEPNSQKYPLSVMKLGYPDKGNFIAVVGKFEQPNMVRKVKKSLLENADIDVKSINAPVFIPGIDFSDHMNYWYEGYPAVMISDTSFYRNANYHLETDTIETLNFDKMAEVVRGTYYALINFE